jgi:hypothetical protein
MIFSCYLIIDRYFREFQDSLKGMKTDSDTERIPEIHQRRRSNSNTGKQLLPLYLPLLFVMSLLVS